LWESVLWGIALLNWWLAGQVLGWVLNRICPPRDFAFTIVKWRFVLEYVGDKPKTRLESAAPSLGEAAWTES
jgi:hypothetical protein